ncbi:heavy metal-binding protein HIP-like [Mytilus californianus]|uniref:heavy metal-binding protein HIP-like n=1 Tax=Mytilus californianus TaxID=6549 RepID=UPI002245228E|nr:heavy metal-binding protein HIP-like [Mytilus californianus]
MENYLTILLLSGLVLLSAFYGYNVEQRIVQIKNDFVNTEVQHKEEMRKVNATLKSMSEQINEHRNKMIEKDNECRKIINQTEEGVVTFKDEFINVEIHHKNEMKKVHEELKSMSGQVNAGLNEMIQKENAYRKELDQTNENVTTLHKETMKLLKETNNRYENTLNDIKKENKEHNGISFSARLGTSIKDIDPWNTVIFDQVISNDGNSYNAATGIFTAPIAGTYYFTSTIFTSTGSILEMSLKVNEQTQMWMYTYAATITGNTATNSIIVKLNKDDTVRLVKHGVWGARPFYIHRVWSTFTGFLL